MTSPRDPFLRSAPLSRRSLLALGLVLFVPTPSALGAPAAGEQPTFSIDALTLPPGLENTRQVDKALRTMLKKEAKRQDWGAGRSSHIEARFHLKRFEFETQGQALIVRATLVGRLPGGRAAESTISFGGKPAQKATLVRQVLGIVATGVIVRLADLERKRRGL
jgi:hypothetical protein